MKYQLRVYNNFHPGDESMAYNSGSYKTYELAALGARAIIAEFLHEHYKPGMKSRYLFMLYGMYGAEPLIIPDEHGKLEKFSARNYANELAFEICKTENNE